MAQNYAKPFYPEKPHPDGVLVKNIEKKSVFVGIAQKTAKL